ncbi:MAG: helix-turn-helix domain-containing protein, partial [Mycobacterium sp.]
MTRPARMVRQRAGVPIYEYRTDPDTPPVSVVRSGPEDFIERGRHIHDFPALWYLPASGLVYVAAAGQVLDPGRLELRDAGVAVFFDPAALGEDARSPWPAWRAHPLLFPFLHGQVGGILRLDVPAARRPAWDGAIRSIETELDVRQDGYRQAALAHLTLLLIDLARLAGPVVAELRRSGEPLLAEVFEVIDRRHAEQLSLRDVAGELGMTPGHLTTVVRRRTGRTVGEWITDRRMAE